MMNVAIQNSQDYAEGISSGLSGHSIGDSIFGLLDHLLQGLFIIGILLFAAWFILVLIRVLIVLRGQGSAAAGEYGEKAGKDIVSLFGSIFSGLHSFLKYLCGVMRNWKGTISFLCIVVLLPWFLVRIGIVKPMYIKTGQVAINIENRDILVPGYHLTFPIISTYVVSQVSDYTFDIKSISGESSELQDVIIDVNLSFRMEESKLAEFYRKNGITSIWNTANSIITPKAIETIKEVVRQYSFKEVQKKSMEVKSGSLTALRNAFKDTGISIEDISIVNIAISSQYAELEKEQLTTQNALEIAKREADIQILRAEGIRKSNEIIGSQKVSPEMLEEKRLDLISTFIDKWNGVAPTSVGGNFLPTNK